MYTYKRKNLPKQTVELTVTIPAKDIEAEYAKAFDQLRGELAVEGFRKGKVPKDIAQKHLQREVVYEQLIRNFVPHAYTDIVQKEEIKPIVQPHIDLVNAKENEDWVIKMVTAETPEVDLGKYKEKVKDAKAKSKAADIWVPGKDKEPTPADKERQKQAEFQSALEALMKEAKVEVADLILQDEAEKRLAKLVDDVQKVGLTMDGYLKSKNLTKDQLNEQIKKEIEDGYKIEFILQAIADKENIQVEKAELDKVFETIKNEKEKQQAQQNAYYYAAFLRKQKTLDFINSL